MRVGIIGAGLQARRRAPVLLDSVGDELVVISSEDGDSARLLSQRFNCDWMKGWEPIIERDDLDAVIVCTPPHLHAPISIAAMERGMHVLCEKPLARDIHSATAIVEAAARTGRTFKCGFNHRHHPALQQIKQWESAGRIGEPLSVRCRYGIGGRPGYESEWRADPNRVGGGQLMEQGIHAVDLARWFLGDFQEATGFVATQFWSTGTLEDNAFALLRTSDGRIAQIHSSLTQWRNLFSFEVIGENAYAGVEGLGGSYGTERAFFAPRDFFGPFLQEVIDFRGDDRSWVAEWQEFKAAIAEHREPVGSARDGLEAMKAVMAVYEAARTGRTETIER